MHKEGQLDELPEETLFDPMTGYSINVPAEDQMPPGWWLPPEVSSRIMTLRAMAGVELHDALWEHVNGTKAS